MKSYIKLSLMFALFIICYVVLNTLSERLIKPYVETRTIHRQGHEYVMMLDSDGNEKVLYSWECKINHNKDDLTYPMRF